MWLFAFTARFNGGALPVAAACRFDHWSIVNVYLHARDPR
jgi:hypothetical protein